MADVSLGFDPSAKKKKKKKVVVDSLDDIPSPNQPEAANGAADDVEPGAMEIGEDVVATDFGKKKKKKKKPELDSVLDDGDTLVDGSADAPTDDGPDYSYDQLLARVFNIMREKNPEMNSGEKRMFLVKPPQIFRAGTKRTAFANFAEICKLLCRTPKHVLAFLLAELGTSGSIDGSNSLIIKGRFQQKHIEAVLRKYIKEYVACHTCKSSKTILQKDTRLFFLQCEACNSRCSVASIKSGFQAQVGRRALLRAAT